MAQVFIGRGARHVEDKLLNDLDALFDRSQSDPTLLRTPIRVVVPSRRLRDHLSAQLVRRRGAAAGLTIHTAHQLALEILDLATAPAQPGATSRAGADLLAVLIRRCARGNSQLQRELGHLADGYAAAVASVMDLLHAGLGEEHVEALTEQLTAIDGAKGAATRRAAALIQVAVEVRQRLQKAELESAIDAMRRATEILGTEPEVALPAQALLIHGFADATGITTDFLDALRRHAQAKLYLDRPPDPVAPDQPDPGVIFSDRFVTRLGASGRPEASEPPAPPIALAEATRVAAMGKAAEARETARRIGALLDAGTTPERIAVVARDLPSRLLYLRSAFRSYGIPWSCAGASGPIDASGRRLQSLLEVLRRGEDVPASRWLDAGVDAGGGWRLHLAINALGAARLRDLAVLEFEPLLDRKGRLPLPARRGLNVIDDDEDGEERVVASRMTVNGQRLERLRTRARSVLTQLRDWPDHAPLAEHGRRLDQFVHRGLAWSKDNAAERSRERLADLAAGLPPALPLSRDEFVQLLAEHVSRRASAPAGGIGGGIQLLTVTEARGLTFENLFVLGLNRGVFPRLIHEDPLLPDGLRGTLAQLLPDLAVKSLWHDEERYLFAQLMSSSPHLTLSWLSHDDDGNPTPVSPLVHRLGMAHPGEVVTAPPMHVRPPDTGPTHPTPTVECAMPVALARQRDALAPMLPIALRELPDAPLPKDPHQWAQSRRELLEEFDPRTTARHELGPWYGFMGGVREKADPRAEDPFVSLVEGLVGCPWQTFLRRTLRLESLPDPWETLPGLDPALVGNVVHQALDAIVRRAWPDAAPDLVDALDGPSEPIPWPSDDELRPIVQDSAVRVLREAGTSLPGLARVLAARAMPFVQTTGGYLWRNSSLLVLGSEAEGATTVPDQKGTARTVRYKADLIAQEGGRLRLIDYKTGVPISKAKGTATRAKDFLAAIRSGRFLQAPLYLQSALQQMNKTGHVMLDTRGEFLFVRPDLEDDVRRYGVSVDDHELLGAMQEVVGRGFAAWDQGTLFPRLVDAQDGKEPRRCNYCEVAEACLRGDSGARRRLVHWNDQRAMQRRQGEPLSDRDRSLNELWFVTEPRETNVEPGETHPEGLR